MSDALGVKVLELLLSAEDRRAAEVGARAGAVEVVEEADDPERAGQSDDVGHDARVPGCSPDDERRRCGFRNSQSWARRSPGKGGWVRQAGVTGHRMTVHPHGGVADRETPCVLGLVTDGTRSGGDVLSTNERCSPVRESETTPRAAPRASTVLRGPASEGMLDRRPGMFAGPRPGVARACHWSRARHRVSTTSSSASSHRRPTPDAEASSRCLAGVPCRFPPRHLDSSSSTKRAGLAGTRDISLGYRDTRFIPPRGPRGVERSRILSASGGPHGSRSAVHLEHRNPDASGEAGVGASGRSAPAAPDPLLCVVHRTGVPSW